MRIMTRWIGLGERLDRVLGNRTGVFPHPGGFLNCRGQTALNLKGIASQGRSLRKRTYLDAWNSGWAWGGRFPENPGLRALEETGGSVLARFTGRGAGTHNKDGGRIFVRGRPGQYCRQTLVEGSFCFGGVGDRGFLNAVFRHLVPQRSVANSKELRRTFLVPMTIGKCVP